MKSVFSSDMLDKQSDPSSVPHNTYKVIDVIPHTPGDILICENFNKVTFADTSILTRQVTDGLKYHTDFNGEVIEVNMSQASK